MTEPCVLTLRPGALGLLFERLEERGCNPLWIEGGGILADCPSCGGKQDLMILPARTEESAS